MTDPLPRHLLILLSLLGALLLTACDRDDDAPPSNAIQPSGLTALHFSTYHFCGLDKLGFVWCAGGNQDGQLGNATHQEAASFVVVQHLTGMEGIAVGLFNTSCAFDDDGRLFCWGSNERGTLGRPDIKRSSIPVSIDNLPPIQSLAMGAYHTCALTKEAQVYCWGDNREGQAGLGDDVQQSHEPTLVEGLDNVTHLVAGALHTCALNQNGEIFCWGKNDHGQLGLGSSRILRTTLPDRVALVPDKAVDLVASNNHTCALFGDNRALYCWGNNDYGQFGLDDLVSRNAPTEVPDIAYVDELAIGGGQVCARIDDKVFCAGEVLRPVEVARQTGEGYFFQPSAALSGTSELWDGVLAICGPLDADAVACRGIEHNALR